MENIFLLMIFGGVLVFILFMREARGAGHQRAVMMACRLGDVKELKFQLRNSRLLAHTPDQNGLTPLHIASLCGHLELMNILLRYRANPNAQDSTGMTPLHAAAMAGHLIAVEVLIHSGAEVDCRNNRGNTPLFLAVWDGHMDIVKILLKHGAEVNTTNLSGEDPLKRAAAHGHIELADILEAAGAVKGTHPGISRTAHPSQRLHAIPPPSKTV